MAERKRPPVKKGKRPAGRKKPVRRKKNPLAALLKPLFTRNEFREDPTGTRFLKLLHMTRQQRSNLLRWGLYIIVCILALVVQDVIMSRIHILGATTDLAVCTILLITVLEGSEVGSVFALLASIVYFFSGTAPGAYSVGLITVLGMLASLLRQQYLHRSSGSIIACTAIAVMLYELGLFSAGIFLGLTLWRRIFVFFLTGIYSSLVLIPLYQLVYRIGLIGGNQWKE